jgi:hypothetical protein
MPASVTEHEIYYVPRVEMEIGATILRENMALCNKVTDI